MDDYIKYEEALKNNYKRVVHWEYDKNRSPFITRWFCYRCGVNRYE